MTGPPALTRVIKNILWHPGRTHYGRDSWIKRPVHLEGAAHIHLGDRVLIQQHGYLSAVREWYGKPHAGQIRIGNGTYIGRYCYFTAAHAIEIGDNCVLSEQVYITDHAHGLHPEAGPILLQDLESKGPVRIGNRCFLGYRCAIMPGVELGEHCVVGTNSVVTRSFPAGSMVAGSPAKLIKRWDSGAWVAASSL